MRTFLTFLTFLALAPAAQAQEPIGIPTYYGSIANFSTALSATDVVCLEGASGKVVRLAGVYLSGSTAAGNVAIDILVLRRIGLNVGGTSITVVPTSGSSSHGSAQATMRAWSVNPTTLGATATPPVGFAIRRMRWEMGPKTSSPDATPMIADVSNNPVTTQPEARGATQAICLNYSSAAAPITTIHFNLAWTEANE